MPEPTYGTTVERVYARLPEAYRTADAAQNWTLKRWLSGIAEVLDDVDEIIARATYVPADKRADFLAALTDLTTYTRPAGIEDPDLGYSPMYETSDLLDGRTANADWLEWLARLTGADLTDVTTEAEKRLATYLGYSSTRVGSKAALRDAVTDMLTGDKYVRIYDHSDSTEVGTASEWDVLVVTRTSESPPLDVMEETVARRRAKPAGVVIHFYPYVITWAILESFFATWTALEAAGSWENIELSGDSLLPP